MTKGSGSLIRRAHAILSRGLMTTMDRRTAAWEEGMKQKDK